MRYEATGRHSAITSAHIAQLGACAAGDANPLPIFDDLATNVVRNLTKTSVIHKFPAGEIIVHEREPLRGLNIILSGIVDLAQVYGDHECGVLLLSAKDLLMPSATLFREPALVTARALTITKIMEIDAAVLQTELKHSAVLASNLMKAISGQWRMAVRNILDLNCRSAPQRLGAFLLRIADLQAESGTAALPISKRHLAIRLGMTSETLSRMLQVVATNGLYLRGRTIIVHDRLSIEKFCGPPPYMDIDERSLDVFAL